MYFFEESEKILLLSYLVGKLYRQTNSIQKNGLYADKRIASYTGNKIVFTFEV